MKPEALSHDLYKTTSYATKALPYVPKKSFYRSWIYLLLAEEIDALKYSKLKRRLQKFWGEEWI